MLTVELLSVFVLIVINGLLAMSELAIVSARPARLKIMAEQRVRGARTAIKLASDPGRFLSSVQIGITLVGVLSGAVSGATLGRRLSLWLEQTGLMSIDVAEALGVGVVVVGITYFSLIIGELVPKQIALRDSEKVAARVAPAMLLIAKVTAPLVFLLDMSGKLLLRAIGQKGEVEEKITQEEVKTIIAEAESAGVLDMDERQMITGVMRLSDRSVRAIMTPRKDVYWIDLEMDEAALRAALVEAPHSRLPVGHDVDTIEGVVHARDIMAALLAGKPLRIKDHMRPGPIVQDTADALALLPILREAEVPMALIHDEYGHFEGIVTPADLMETIAGTFHAHEKDEAVRRADGSWLFSGSLPVDEMAEHLSLNLPEDYDYHTVAGFILAKFQRLPATGESVTAMNWCFEVVDLDGRRIDKILASPCPEEKSIL